MNKHYIPENKGGRHWLYVGNLWDSGWSYLITCAFMLTTSCLRLTWLLFAHSASIYFLILCHDSTVLKLFTSMQRRLCHVKWGNLRLMYVWFYAYILTFPCAIRLIIKKMVLFFIKHNMWQWKIPYTGFFCMPSVSSF